MKKPAAMGGMLALLTAAVAMAYEEPIYQVLEQADQYEVRRYEPYLVAEVDVEGDFGGAGNDAFRILAAYIFGENEASQKMHMTAPVESRSSGEGVRMSMTTPATSAATSPGQYTYAFVMERKYDLDSLPRPNDPRIRIREQEPRVMAVRRYSGRWTEANYRKNESRLLQELSADDRRPVGEPILARYDSPFTPWFLRRNEVMVEVEWTEGVEPSSAE